MKKLIFWGLAGFVGYKIIQSRQQKQTTLPIIEELPQVIAPAPTTTSTTTALPTIQTVAEIQPEEIVITEVPKSAQLESSTNMFAY